jgi:hypothetical protein
MAEHQSAHSPEHCNHLTRRAALHGAAAIGALALPAGAAAAAELPGDVDPGLARIEAGYARWQALQAERDRLDQIARELLARANEAIAPMLPPEPPIPPELEPYGHYHDRMGKKIVWWGTVPRKGTVRKIADAHYRAETEWRDLRNEPLDGLPDYEKAGEIEAEREELCDDALELRKQVLAIPTRSPRGLLIKLTIAIEARSVRRHRRAVRQSLILRHVWRLGERGSSARARGRSAGDHGAGGSMSETFDTRLPRTADFGAIITEVVDAMVEEIAGQIAGPGDELAAQAELYEAIAQTCGTKAQLARALDQGGSPAAIATRSPAHTRGGFGRPFVAVALPPCEFGAINLPPPLQHSSIN